MQAVSSHHLHNNNNNHNVYRTSVSSIHASRKRIFFFSLNSCFVSFLHILVVLTCSLLTCIRSPVSCPLSIHILSMSTFSRRFFFLCFLFLLPFSASFFVSSPFSCLANFTCMCDLPLSIYLWLMLPRA